ncbi:hypothetical protein RN001_006851 [Aquatica leii]|uniref:RRM domain-containing protein n=1 Tax=Aquatica leii TaxID=1421715 RepID=A0AAN7SIT8_9COLE|nr:hypothetical protein RN001_006851 [Aquatica leii]
MEEDIQKPEPSFIAYSENSESKPTEENQQTHRNKQANLKAKPMAKPGFRHKEQNFQREDQMINEKLAMINVPTTNLSPIKYVEQKFSGRSRLFIGNLPPKITEDEIKTIFSKYGETGEIFLNQSKGFGFIKMDYSVNAERAKKELIRYNLHGRSMIIRNAHPPTIRVKNVPLFVSNELLHAAFSIFGEIEHAFVIVDPRGKPTGEGIIEYFKRSSVALAMKKCNEGCFFLTSSLKPVIVESNEPPLDTTGYTEATIRRNQDYYRERENGPRFATPGSFQFVYAERWKELYKNYEAKLQALKAEQFFEEQKLEAQMMSAQYDHETERLKEMLRIREIDRKRFKQDWEMRQRQLEEQCFHERHKFGDNGERIQDSLYVQASQLNNLLDTEEQQLQAQWRVADNQQPSSSCWSNSGSENSRFRPIKRPRRE